MVSIDPLPSPRERPEDPDAQATVNDYLDYTEYLPSDLNRALTLISKLDESYLDRANAVHELTRQYGASALPSPSLEKDHAALRRDISYNLSLAMKAREAAYGEADRLHEMVNRHYNRLVGIRVKLLALPKPPSRDPTPVARSPQATRKTPTRITLRMDSARLGNSTGRLAEKEKRKAHRSRRVTIPGEVLPPPNSDSPLEYTESDWDSIPPSPLPMPTSRVGGSRSRSHKSSRSRPPKISGATQERSAREPRIPGKGTNVHSQVAGISTTNALSMLPKPPPDAECGSEHAPWMRLTEYEMALLRKKMKKNAIWTPSETMIRRELAAAGRGPENYRARKAECMENGEDFLDVDDVASSSPSKPLAPGEIRADSLGAVSENLSNRGMKLNEAKKQKREALLLASLHETQQATKRLESLGTNFKELFKKPMSHALESPMTPSSYVFSKQPQSDQLVRSKKKKSDAGKKMTEERSSKKHTHGATPKIDIPQPVATPSTANAPTSGFQGKEKAKKRKADPATALEKGTAITAPSDPRASGFPTSREVPRKRSKSASPLYAATLTQGKQHWADRNIGKATASAGRTRHAPLTLRGPALPSNADSKARRSSYDDFRLQSEGPLSAPLTRSTARRKSATPATPTTPAPVMTAASRRSRRPAPGHVQKDHEGGATVSVDRRERLPRDGKDMLGRWDAKGNENEPIGGPAGEEAKDADNTRYCVCDDISYGMMVFCENENVGVPHPHKAGASFSLTPTSTVRTRMVPLSVRWPDARSSEKDQVVLPRMQANVQEMMRGDLDNEIEAVQATDILPHRS